MDLIRLTSWKTGGPIWIVRSQIVALSPYLDRARIKAGDRIYDVRESVPTILAALECPEAAAEAARIIADLVIDE